MVYSSSLSDVLQQHGRRDEVKDESLSSVRRVNVRLKISTGDARMHTYMTHYDVVFVF